MASNRKPAAKKTAAKKTAAAKPKAPEVEATTEPKAEPISNMPRTAGAAEQLIREVEAIWPETTHEVSGHNRFNTALHVAFHPEEFERVDETLALISDDPRVEEILAEPDDHTILVCLRDSLRTYDDRTPFNLAQAWAVLAEKYGDLS